MSPRITILAFGTRGDVAPLTGLASRLGHELGAHVAIAAQQPYEQMVVGSGHEFRLLPRDTERDTRGSHYGQAMVDGERLKPSRAAIEGMRQDLVGVGEAMAAAGEDADLILCAGPVGTMLGWHVAEALHCPSAALVLQPSTPTADFPPPPLGVRSYGRLGNRMAWRMSAVGEKLFTPLIDDLRAHLDLPHRSRRSYQRHRSENWTYLCGFSDHVVPRPRDWPDHVHVTGYWWPTVAAEKLPPEIDSFLASGSAPVYVGIGSTAISTGENLSELVRSALKAAGRRGVIHRGWAHLDGGEDPDMLTIDDVDHAVLLPRMTAALHHCGAGTTAASLRAGIPSIPLPGIMDQPFWANRLHRLGCSPEPIPRTTATIDSVARAIESAVSDESVFRRNAESLSGQLAAQEGTLAATRLIEDMLETHSRQ
ncbi:glycosyltransferase [Gordonia westfalica]|uniref:Glycosyltransferase n=1 Tax=Gordonia westfalica TaxID=158898 RepID=A0ABU2GZL4_9ACTN|nr:glycosyltransferase [Gordonia westfalica]MDS1116871.1 glycosyltransferase [Gordonia westfalica]